MGRVKAKISDDETAMTDLKPANENPWYVLMTLYGEQTDFFDRELHEKNRAGWLAWFWEELPERVKTENLDWVRSVVGHIIPNFKRDAMAKMAKRLKLEAEFPDLSKAEIRLTGLLFDNLLACSNFYFPRRLVFRNCQFNNTVNFSAAEFASEADFQFLDARQSFLGSELVSSNSFLFRSNSIGERLSFARARFRGGFDAAFSRCLGGADFRAAIFEEQTSFFHSKLLGGGRYENAKFVKAVGFGSTELGGASSSASRQTQKFLSHSQEKLGDVVRFDGVEFLEELTFSNGRFLSSVSFAGCLFRSSVNFVSVVADGSIDLLQGEFSGCALFKNCKINGDLKFEKSEIPQGIIMRQTILQGSFRCDNMVLGTPGLLCGARGSTEPKCLFGSVQIFRMQSRGEVEFAGVQLRKASHFLNAEFQDYVSFINCEFEEVRVTGSDFRDRANFLSCHFDGSADFSRSKFSGIVSFEECEFGADRRADYSLSLLEAEFDKTVSLRDARFLESYPTLLAAEFKGGVVVSSKHECWPTEIPENLESAKDACATLRHVMSKQGLPEEEHFFFRKEMELLAKSQTPLARFPNDVFRWLSNYGESISRPAAALLALWLFPALVYLICFAWVDVQTNAAWRWVEPFSFSFANVFKFLGFQRLYFAEVFRGDIHVLLQGLAGIQTILGFVLVFLLGLGLRTRFRLR